MKNTNPHPGREHYYDTEYDSLDRFCGYWTQIQEILTINPTSVLEIGGGNKLVSDYLKRRDIHVTELDLIYNIHPDVVGSIDQIPFESNSFDVSTACQVLEHIPFDLLEVALKELARVSKRHIIISVPNASRVVVMIWGLTFRARKKIFEIGWLQPRGTYHSRYGHYWELGWKDYPFSRIEAVINRAGLKIIKQYRVPERPYQHFFILEKPLSDRKA